MGLMGKYVKTFREASHALPDGMHMNADYPFMLPPIVAIENRGKDGRFVTLKGRDGTAEFAVRTDAKGMERCCVVQSSTFETLFGRPPKAFWCHPFKDEDTPAIGQRSE